MSTSSERVNTRNRANPERVRTTQFDSDKGVARKDEPPYLYSITLPDGRVYIGRSGDPENRFTEHCKASSYIGEAIRHYGAENCKLRILCVGEETYISELEDFAIDAFKTFYPFGCNRTGGRTGYGIDGLGESNRVGLVVESAYERPVIAPEFRDSTYVESFHPRDEFTKDLSGTPLDVIIGLGAAPEKPANSGWTEIMVNTQGRHAIELIFPGWAFGWRHVQWPRKGWQSVLLHLPSLAKNKANFIQSEFHRLNQLPGLDDAQLACSLARAVSDQGVRAAWLTYAGNGQPVLHFPENKSQRRAPTALIRSGKGLSFKILPPI
jgi:hypothetical protein